MTDMVFGSVAARPGEPGFARWWRSVDRWALAAALGLALVGILLAFAASVPLAEKHGQPTYRYVTQHAVYVALALALAVALSMQTPVTIRRLAVIGFFLAFGAVCLLPAFGTNFGKGAIRWYSLGFTSVQPSEFLKPAFAVLVAWLMAASFDPRGPPGRLLSFLLAAAVAGVLARQPDHGQAALILATWGVMYFISGAPLLLLALLGGGGVLYGVLAYRYSAHFAGRIDRFLAPDVEATSQLGFAEEAIRAGGLLGLGIGEGNVKWHLPDAHTDFIIAVAVEEYGVAMCLLIVALVLVIVLGALHRLRRERDPFARLAGTGLAALFGLQAFINISVAARLLPAKGMTLPFVSYGGSSLIATGILLGALLALTRRRPQEDLAEALAAGRAA